MKNNLLLVLLFAFLSISSSFGQTESKTNKNTHKIKGTVFGARSQKPLEYANMLVVSYNDSTTVAGSTSNSKGVFIIKNIPEGKYYLLAKYIGYKKRTIPNINFDSESSDIHLDPILLVPKAENLKEVEVNGQKEYVEFDAEKRVLKVTPKMATQYPSAADLVINLPSVTSSSEGIISLRGSRMFIVLIDNHPTIVDNQQALQMLASSRIQKIELITTPGAKYDASGEVGIINFITKKEHKNDDFSGNIRTTNRTTGTATANLNLNYTKNKVSVSAGYSGNSRADKADKSMDYSISTSNSYQGDAEKYSNTHLGWLTAELDLSKQTKLSIGGELGNLKYDLNGFLNNDKGTSANLRDQNYDIRIFKTVFSHNFKKPNHNISLFFQNQKKNGFHHIWMINKGMLNSTMVNTTQKTYAEQINNQVELDYTLPVSKKIKLELGYHLKTADRFKELKESSIQKNSPGFYYYDRTIHAGYTTFQYKLKRSSVKVGLRGENVDRDFDDRVAGVKYKYDKFVLYPSASFNTSISKSLRVQANYSRRTNRLMAKDLEPFISPLSFWNQYYGNPQLKPSFINSYEVVFMKRIKRSTLSLELFHRSSKNINTNWITLADNGIKQYGSINAGRENMTGVVLSSRYVSKNKKLTLRPILDLYNHYQSAVLQSSSFNSFRYSFYCNLNWKFAPNYALLSTAVVKGKRKTTQGYYKAYFTSSIAIQRNFFKNKLLTSLTINDPFNTGVSKQVIRLNDEVLNYRFKRKNRYVSLTLFYRFNNFSKSRNRLNRQSIRDREGF